MSVREEGEVAQLAFTLVKQHRNNAESAEWTNYCNEAAALPARLRVLGLGQTLAYLHPRKADSDPDTKKPLPQARLRLLEDLNMCIARSPGFAEVSGTNHGRILARFMRGTEGEYRRASMTALRFSEWLKFAAASCDTANSVSVRGASQ